MWLATTESIGCLEEFEMIYCLVEEVKIKEMVKMEMTFSGVLSSLFNTYLAFLVAEQFNGIATS
jgi:hypothetical protein